MHVHSYWGFDFLSTIKHGKIIIYACFMHFIVFGVCNILVNKKNIDQVKVSQKIFPYLYIIFFF